MRCFNFRRRNFQDFRSGIYEQTDGSLVQVDYDDPIFLGGLNICFAEALTKINDRNNLSAEIDDAFDIIRGVRNGSDGGNANNFAHDRNRHTESLSADAKADDLYVLVHGGSGRLRVH